MPEFTRQPLLKPEVEAELEKDLTRFWFSKDKDGRKYKGKDIARMLCFGVEGMPYEKLKPCYVYYYRQKFGLHRRRKAPFRKGTSRYKDKQEEIMPWQQFESVLNERVPKCPSNRRKRSYLILHYWTPLRSSEIFQRKIDDFELMQTKLIIHLLRKKKHYKPSEKDEPLEVPLALPLMNEVVEWLEGKEWKVEPPRPTKRKLKHKRRLNPENRPWNISSWTAWKYVSEVFPNYYPHFWRFNWITQAFAKHADIPELKAATGLHIVTLNSYVMAPKRLQSQIYDRILDEVAAQKQ